MLLRMDLFVIVLRLKVGDDLGGHRKLFRQALFNQRRKSMCVSQQNRCGEQEVNLNQLPVTCRTEAHAMIANAEFSTNRIKFLPDFLSRIGIGVVKQPLRGAPDEMAAGPQLHHRYAAAA